jgi:hypothetical protein
VAVLFDLYAGFSRRRVLFAYAASHRYLCYIQALFFAKYRLFYVMGEPRPVVSGAALWQ